MYDHIVVPLDGSEFSRAAIPYALAASGGPATQVELVSAVHVLGTVAAPGWMPGAGAGLSVYQTGMEIPAGTDLLQLSLQRRREDLQTIAAEVSPEARATVVCCTVLEGEPSAAIAAHAESSGADLIVMSTHGRGGLERAWIGSVADRLVRRVPVPILLVRPSHEAPGERTPPTIQRVLVPLDGSPLAESVLESAGELAQRLDAELVLLRVLESDLTADSPYLPAVATQQEDHLRDVERQAGEYLETVAGRLEAQGVRVADRLLRTGSPSRVISSVARDVAQVTAMATHGRGGLQRFLLGSVSDKVLRSSEQPVLLVPSREDSD